MLLIWARKKKVRELVLKHLMCVRETIDVFAEASDICVRNSDLEARKRLALATHQAEGRADEVRREVAKTLIEGALMPISRRQVLGIVERVDTLANAAEASLDYFIDQQVEVPESLRPAFLGILRETEEVFDNVECAVRLVFSPGRTNILECMHRIEQGEATIDGLERDLVSCVFRSNLDLGRKIHLRGYVETLTEISDRAEDLSDSIALVVAEQAF